MDAGESQENIAFLILLLADDTQRFLDAGGFRVDEAREVERVQVNPAQPFSFVVVVVIIDFVLVGKLVIAVLIVVLVFVIFLFFPLVIIFAIIHAPTRGSEGEPGREERSRDSGRKRDLRYAVGERRQSLLKIGWEKVRVMLSLRVVVMVLVRHVRVRRMDVTQEMSRKGTIFPGGHGGRQGGDRGGS